MFGTVVQGDTEEHELWIFQGLRSAENATIIFTFYRKDVSEFDKRMLWTVSKISCIRLISLTIYTVFLKRVMEELEAE